jgi:hypothetical protein
VHLDRVEISVIAHNDHFIGLEPLSNFQHQLIGCPMVIRAVRIWYQNRAFDCHTLSVQHISQKSRKDFCIDTHYQYKYSAMCQNRSATILAKPKAKPFFSIRSIFS